MSNPSFTKLTSCSNKLHIEWEVMSSALNFTDKTLTSLMKTLFHSFLSYLSCSPLVKLVMPTVSVFSPYPLSFLPDRTELLLVLQNFCLQKVTRTVRGVWNAEDNWFKDINEFFILFFLSLPKLSTIAACQVKDFIALLAMLSRFFSFDTINLELTKV